MNPATIATLLQLMSSLLLGVQNNPQVSQAAMEQAIAAANQAVQLSVQAMAAPKISFAVPANNSTWPNITDLAQSAYLDANGNYVPLAANASAPGVSLLEQYTSFGDLNGDGLDDAAVVVQRTDASGNQTFDLAAMLNQGSVMFNIADAAIGEVGGGVGAGANSAGAVQILSHHIVQGGDIVLNTQTGNAAAQTSTYKLVGDELVKM